MYTLNLADAQNLARNSMLDLIYCSRYSDNNNNNNNNNTNNNNYYYYDYPLGSAANPIIIPDDDIEVDLYDYPLRTPDFSLF